MREISGLAKFGYFCVGLFGGLFGVLAAWFMGKDGWGWSEGGKLFAEIGEDREVMGFKELHDTKTPMNPDEPGLGPVSNQLVMLGSRSDGRGNFSSRFASTFGTINAYGHASS